jgi:hypothetical protein
MSVGIQKNYPPFGQPDHGFQRLACGAHARIYDGLAIELRPQPSSDFWLGSTTAEGTISPGGQESLSISVAWQRPSRIGPLRSQIIVDSSDRTHPSLTLPVQVASLPALHERWLGTILRARRITDDGQ